MRDFFIDVLLSCEEDDLVNSLKLTFFIVLFLPYGDPSSDSHKLIDWSLFEGSTGMK